METATKGWSTLDNAAKIFPAILRKNYTTFFRMEVLLKEVLVVEALEEAITLTLARFPLLQTRVRRGFFWYFFEPYNHPVSIKAIDEYEMCYYSKLSGSKQEAPWRVLIKGKRLAVEISHIISDGIGAMEFFKTLLCVYYELMYGKIKDWGGVKRLDDEINPAEEEYSYKKYFSKIKSSKHQHSNAFHFPDERSSIYRGSRMLMPLDKIKALSNSYGVSVTEFLTAIEMSSLQNLYKNILRKKKGVIRELVLVNLRNIFPSQTLRNFYLFVMPDINFALGEYSLEEIIKKVHHQVQNMLDKREIQKHFSDYVSAEEDILCRIVPRPIKDFFLGWIQKITGENKHTKSISNLGKISLPSELSSLISSFALFPVPSESSGKNTGIIGYENTLTISISGYIASLDFEREIANQLRSLGVDITFLEW